MPTFALAIQHNREYTILVVTSQERKENDKGAYHTRTEYHRVYTWSKPSKFASKLKAASSSCQGVL